LKLIDQIFWEFPSGFRELLWTEEELCMKLFLSEDFLLQTDTAKALYHDFARDMPIIDYHCHLPVQEIAENRSFENLTQI
jgi:hypothetical protein